MAGLKLVSVNIERSKHLDRVERFLTDQQSDLICVQELAERDISRIESILGARCIYAPMIRIPSEFPGGDSYISGVGIFTKHPILRNHIEYYVGNEVGARSVEDHPSDRNRAIIACDIAVAGDTYRIVTTHFTWTPKGDVSDEQREDLERLFSVLAPLGEFALCGDFNAPRIYKGKPGVIFSKLSEKYKDNIPSQYETSIDLNLHRAGKIRPHELVDKMVDGLFTTRGYVASDVVLHTGVSDHCAITARISR
jgi:endonuclease/exonuclease/phosphatase family metal-dependent hydrolase